MSTSTALQKPPSWWRSVLLLLGCCELFPFTREGFGRGYFLVLWVAFVLRSMILLPFPTAYGYMNFQLVVSFALILQFAERLRPVWRVLLTQIDRFDPGKPGRVMILANNRSFFFLFLLEPGLALVASFFLATTVRVINPWTVPFFLAFSPRADHNRYVISDLPEALQSYTYWGMDFFAGVDQANVALVLLVLFPVSVLLNNVAEVLAERAQPPPLIPQSNEPQLTFPTVGGLRKSSGSGLPSFRSLGEKLRRKKD